MRTRSGAKRGKNAFDQVVVGFGFAPDWLNWSCFLACLPACICQTIIYLKRFFLLQRQSRLDEVTGRTGEPDGLGGIPSSQPPLTTPLERRDIPPQLSMTLEHIVGQLDVLTQV